jgi:hypothetical protein
MDAVFRLLSRGTKENQEKPDFSIVGDPHKNRTENFPKITFFSGTSDITGQMPYHFLCFEFTLRHTTFRRNLLEEGSPRRRDLYLTTCNVKKSGYPCLRRDF